jgi:hypothetical protein
MKNASRARATTMWMGTPLAAWRERTAVAVFVLLLLLAVDELVVLLSAEREVKPLEVELVFELVERPGPGAGVDGLLTGA